ncbi:hypothetical protein HALLA_04820 [Halostagnicola larsenii XH-48]|uniref:Uncharacterized protein n=1 Tax=Halostagnicola larsenii XH-48 TaxID=797299 RepID=W0JHX4_9EURY|nr:hypothetical protein [Halostagnicola larsenii]AHF98295.1 hypothetical protein HALLA_04820 [Halostagnicola larsenii XH-48]
MGELTRRRVLAVAGATTMGSVAGCMGSGDDGPDGDAEDGGNESDGGGDGESDGGDSTGTDDGADDAESADRTGTVLGDITVENLDDASHTIDVLVEFDGEIEAWSTEVLETNGDSTTLERNWPSDPGSFRVIARVDGEELREATPADWNDPDCFNLFISVRGDDSVTIASGTSGGPCGSGEADADDTTAAD